MEQKQLVSVAHVALYSLLTILAVSLNKPISLIEQGVLSKSAATFVLDTWPNYESFPTHNDNVYKLQARHGVGATLKGFVSAFDGTISILATPTSLLLLATSLAEISASGKSVVVHVAANSTNLAELFEALQILSFSPQAFQGEIAFSGGHGALEVVEAAAAAYTKQGKTVVNVFDDLEAGQEFTLLPAFESVSADVSKPVTYSGPAEPHAVIVLPSSAHAGSAVAALQGLRDAAPAQKIGIVTVAAINAADIGSALDAVIPKSVQSVFAPTVMTGIDETATWFYDTVLAAVVSSGKVAALVQPLGVVQSWTVNEWAATIVRLASPSSSKAFEVSKVHSILPESSKLATFWSSDVGASAGVPEAIARAFGAESGVTPRLLETFDNLAGGKSASGLGLKSSDLLLSPSSPESASSASLSAIALTAEPGLIFVSAPQFVLPTYNAVERAGEKTQIVFSSPWSAEEYAEKLPRYEKNKLLTHTGLYTINADSVAKEAGAAGQAGVAVVEQTAFWLKYLPENETGLISKLVSSSLSPDTVNALIEATKSGLHHIDLSGSGMDVDEEDAARPDKQLAPGEADSSIISHPSYISAAKAGHGINAYKSIPEPTVDASSWHAAAKQLLYPEAYGLVTEEEEKLRPDLPEKNFIVTVTENRRLTPTDYDRNVFHMEFSTAGTGLKYAVGEALGIHGLNDEQEVRDFIEWYGFNADDVVSYPARDDPSKIETRTVFQLFQQTLDIFGKPPKSFYEVLSGYASTREEARHLRFIASAEGSATFKKWAELDTVTYVDVLKAFPSARENFRLADFVKEITPIKPRHYSIASSQNAVGDSVHLLVVTVDWDTPAGAKRYGQCTRYLVGLKVGAKVMVSIKPSVMKLPPRDTQPIIMAGLGTGAAPFRAFMQERAWQKQQGMDVGPLLYYFGARYRHAEYLYGEEIEAYVRDSVITHTGLAFSRDTKQKVYIQHRMNQDGKLLADSLDDGVFYLCGPTWPVPDVYKALTDALSEHRGKTIEEAEAKIEELKEEERYVLEVCELTCVARTTTRRLTFLFAD